MKTLDEKRLLVKMAKMLGQPVDPALILSIEKEEKLNEAFFGKPSDFAMEEIKTPATPQPILIEIENI